MKRSERYLWLVLALMMPGAGCALDKRKVVVRQEEVAKQNDPDWKITKEPQRGQQAGQR